MLCLLSLWWSIEEWPQSVIKIFCFGNGGLVWEIGEVFRSRGIGD